MGRVLVRKVCDLEDREVSQSEIGNGYEYAKDQVVPISDAELRELPLPTAKVAHLDALKVDHRVEITAPPPAG